MKNKSYCRSLFAQNNKRETPLVYWKQAAAILRQLHTDYFTEVDGLIAEFTAAAPASPNTIRIQMCSDLHIEFGTSKNILVNPSADYLALLGGKT